MNVEGKQDMIIVTSSEETSAPSSSSVQGSLSGVAAGEDAVTGTHNGAENSSIPMEVEDDSGALDPIQVCTSTLILITATQDIEPLQNYFILRMLPTILYTTIRLSPSLSLSQSLSLLLQMLLVLSRPPLLVMVHLILLRVLLLLFSNQRNPWQVLI